MLLKTIYYEMYNLIDECNIIFLENTIYYNSKLLTIWQNDKNMSVYTPQKKSPLKLLMYYETLVLEK